MTAFYTAQKSLREEYTPQDRIRQFAEEHSLCSVRTTFVTSVLTALKPQHLFARVETIEQALSTTGYIAPHDVWAWELWEGLTKPKNLGLQDSDQFVLAYAKALAEIINPQHPAKTLEWLWNNQVYASATVFSHGRDKLRADSFPIYNECQVLMDLYTPSVFKQQDIWRLFVGVNRNGDSCPYVINKRIFQLSSVDSMSTEHSEPVLFSVLDSAWKCAGTEMRGYGFEHENFLSELDKIVEMLATRIEQEVDWDESRDISPSRRARNVKPFAKWPVFRAQMRFDALRHCSLKPQDTADEYLIEAIMLGKLSDTRINDLINSSLERLFARFHAKLNNAESIYSFNVFDYEPCAVFYFTRHRDAWLNRFLECTFDEELNTHVRISTLGTRLPTVFPSCADYPSELMARMQNQESFATVRVSKHFLPLETMAAHKVIGGLYGEDPHCTWMTDFPENHREKWQKAFFDLEETLSRDRSEYAYWVHTLAANNHVEGPELVPYLEKALACMVRRFGADDSFESIGGYREIITRLGHLDPAKLLNQLLRAYRAAPVPTGCDPTVVSWNTESVYFRDTDSHVHPVDALTYLIAKEIPKLFKAYRQPDKKEGELRLDTELAKICLSRLKVASLKTSAKSYSNDDCIEAAWAFRCSYIKAIEELHSNAGGKSHKHLDFIRKGDPDERVKKVAYASYAAVRHAKPHTDERSRHRAYLAAFWWIRIGKAESEGIDVDMKIATRQRRRELRYIT